MGSFRVGILSYLYVVDLQLTVHVAQPGTHPPSGHSVISYFCMSALGGSPILPILGKGSPAMVAVSRQDLMYLCTNPHLPLTVKGVFLPTTIGNHSYIIWSFSSHTKLITLMPHITGVQ